MTQDVVALNEYVFFPFPRRICFWEKFGTVVAQKGLNYVFCCKMDQQLISLLPKDQARPRLTYRPSAGRLNPANNCSHPIWGTE